MATFFSFVEFVQEILLDDPKCAKILNSQHNLRIIQKQLLLGIEHFLFVFEALKQVDILIKILRPISLLEDSLTRYEAELEFHSLWKKNKI